MLRHVLKLPLCVSEPGNGSVIAHFYLIVTPLSHELFQMLLWFLALGSKHAVLLTLVPTLQAQTMVLLVFEPFFVPTGCGERIPFMPNSVDNKKQDRSWMPASEGWAARAVWVSPSPYSILGCLRGAGEGRAAGQRRLEFHTGMARGGCTPQQRCSQTPATAPSGCWVFLVSPRDAAGAEEPAGSVAAWAEPCARHSQGCCCAWRRGLRAGRIL